ncbi:hypothetical protein CFC21_042007 [Triticum aestivum]|uniref:Uncharacterized protein n=2 Tax=Triticum aestivum TaxID=4565 RepID=A0A9R1FKZ1_WHEAT|nr:hypothetical protein CFC21_042007 [Triticum aestivum]CDM83986.1 unnamed protein product [Triticum aestivum]
MENGDETWLDNQLDNIVPNDFVDLPNDDENKCGNNDLGNTLRDEIAMQIWEAYHGSPKYNIMKANGKKASHGTKKPSPKIKKTPPRVKSQELNSWPEITKFQNKPFPLYDKLGGLYDGHIAEGNFNFTSTKVTQVSDGDPEVEREQTAFSFYLNQYNDDVHMYNNQRDVAQSDVASNKKHVKELKKGKKRDDPMVEVMAQYVEIKWKQVKEESALLVGSKNAQELSISKCIVVLHKMESFQHCERADAYKVFKNAENHDIFLNSAAQDEESVVVFLRNKMVELPQRI